MSIAAFSISTGNQILAADADYQSYRDELPVCGRCFGEVCLACGEKKIPYWRHFPGVGISCPDRSEVKTIVYQPTKFTNRKQSLALFRQRFLEILDYGVQPALMGANNELHQLSFTEQVMIEVAKQVKIECNDKVASFDAVMLKIYSKHRKRADIIENLINISVKNLYSEKFIEFDVDYQLKKQIAQIAKQYFDIQLSTAQLAARYALTPGKENVLIPIMAYCWLNYKSKSIKCNYIDLPTSLVIICVNILGAVPWFHIMNALTNKHKPQSQPINPSYIISDEGLSILTREFHKSLPKRQVQGFNDGNK